MAPSIEILLSEDHQTIDRLYDEYLDVKLSRPAAAMDSFRKYKTSLLKPIKCEEDLVFPILLRFPTERACEEVFTLREEHQIIIPLLMEVEKQLARGGDLAHSERRLFEELHEHNAREEMHVYGPLDRLLTEAEKQAVVAVLPAH